MYIDCREALISLFDNNKKFAAITSNKVTGSLIHNISIGCATILLWDPGASIQSLGSQILSLSVKHANLFPSQSSLNTSLCLHCGVLVVNVLL